jgi:16S rRNA (adenine1518-N6/adenine1519-N6)-dimethyltransferase
LTDLLSRRAAKVICVEIDRDLCEILRERFGWDERVAILEGDVLRGKHRLSNAVDHALRSTDGGLDVKLVANLPYQAATPLVMNLLLDYPQVRRLCFTVQAEVGDRITAKPDGKNYGPLAIISQTLCDIRQVARIGPQAFWPQPTVDSVMLRLDVTREPLPGEMGEFAEFVRGMFDHRRKQLRTAAAYVASRDCVEALARGFDLSRRPEAVPVHEWLGMYRVFRNGGEVRVTA